MCWVNLFLHGNFMFITNSMEQSLSWNVIVSQLVKKIFPAFYGTWKFIAVFKWATSIRSTHTFYFFMTHFNIIRPSALRSSEWSENQTTTLRHDSEKNGLFIFGELRLSVPRNALSSNYNFLGAAQFTFSRVQLVLAGSSTFHLRCSLYSTLLKRINLPFTAWLVG